MDRLPEILKDVLAVTEFEFILLMLGAALAFVRVSLWRNLSTILLLISTYRSFKQLPFVLSDLGDHNRKLIALEKDK